MNSKEFNLTTADGRKQALETIEKLGWGISPYPWLAKKALEWISSPETIKEQRKTAVELIKTGHEKNVDEMKITINEMAGVDIGAQVDGIPIKAKIGKSGEIILEVKYRSA